LIFLDFSSPQGFFFVKKKLLQSAYFTTVNNSIKNFLCFTTLEKRTRIFLLESFLIVSPFSWPLRIARNNKKKALRKKLKLQKIHAPFLKTFQSKRLFQRFGKKFLFQGKSQYFYFQKKDIDERILIQKLHEVLLGKALYFFLLLFWVRRLGNPVNLHYMDISESREIYWIDRNLKYQKMGYIH